MTVSSLMNLSDWNKVQDNEYEELVAIVEKYKNKYSYKIFALDSNIDVKFWRNVRVEMMSSGEIDKFNKYISKFKNMNTYLNDIFRNPREELDPNTHKKK